MKDFSEWNGDNIHAKEL